MFWKVFWIWVSGLAHDHRHAGPGRRAVQLPGEEGGSLEDEGPHWTCIILYNVWLKEGVKILKGKIIIINVAFPFKIECFITYLSFHCVVKFSDKIYKFTKINKYM